MTIKKNKPFSFSTRLIHSGTADSLTGAVMPSISVSTSYAQESPGVNKGFEYIRCGNPTRMEYERCIADLETGRHGFAFASGMAAIASVLELLKSGSHVIAADNVYGGSYRLFKKVRKYSAGLEFSFVDMTRPENIARAIQQNTKMIWIESPSNPLLKIVEFKKVIKIARSRGLLAVIDNTFATPYLQRPLEHGFDIVVHSATKYLNGHSDVLNGVVVVGDNAELAEKLKFIQISVGAVASPFDCFLALRGVRTLSLRMQKHCENAIELARWLEKHKKTEKVYYPGLASHPQHKLAVAQMSAFGGVISVLFKEGGNKARKFLQKCNLFTLADSLGGIESLISLPSAMSHASLSVKMRTELGISDNLVRLSVGIEDINDLVKDLSQALK